MEINKKELKIITETEVLEKLKDFQIWKRSNGKEGSNDFSNLDFSIMDYFEDINGEYNNYYKLKDIFRYKDLSGADFKNSNITILDFTGANLYGTDFRGCTHNSGDSKFSKEQLENYIILTNEDYNKYIEKIKLEEENKSLKIELNNTSKTQTNKLLEGFEDLKNDYFLEERKWLTISIVVFFILLGFYIIIFIDIIFPELTKKFMYMFFGSFIFIILNILYAISKNNNFKINKNKIKFLSIPNFEDIKNTIINTILLIYGIGYLYYLYYLGNIGENQSSIIKVENPYYIIISISIVIFSFLYFSIVQYSNTKKLRIENQNKIAMIHGFQALRAEKGDGVEKGRFYNNIANVVFKSIYEEKNQGNLPIDKIIDLVKEITVAKIKDKE
ncbi:MAG: pentapeptide repeat-containing protein [Candidatus Gracilibacteria bacterium]|nr:pentapeptide repeat-containing protein [Candidatus Gracilibacteria bacterium]